MVKTIANISYPHSVCPRSKFHVIKRYGVVFTVKSKLLHIYAKDVVFDCIMTKEYQPSKTDVSKENCCCYAVPQGNVLAHYAALNISSMSHTSKTGVPRV